MRPSFPRSLLDALPLGLMVLDGTGRILAANGRARRATGIGSGALAGENVFDRWGGVAGLEGCRERFQEGSAFEATARFLPSGRDNPVRVRIEPLEEDGERFGLVTLDTRSLPQEAVSAMRHDINNLLMGLMGHVELLQEYPELSDRARSKVRSIAGQVDRIRDRFSEFARATRKPTESPG